MASTGIDKIAPERSDNDVQKFGEGALRCIALMASEIASIRYTLHRKMHVYRWNSFDIKAE